MNTRRDLPLVYILVGSDPAAIEHEIAAAVTNHEVPPHQAKPQILHGDELNLETLLLTLNSYSFFSQKRIITVKEFNTFLNRLSTSEEKRLLQYIAHPNPKSVLFCEVKTLPKQSFMKHCTPPACRTITLRSHDRVRADEIIRALMKEYGVQLPARWIEQILQRFKNDVGTLENEVRKLMLYLSQQPQETAQPNDREAEIANLITTYFETSVFGLLDQIGAKNIPEALKILQRLRWQGEHPVNIFHQIMRHRRLLNLVSFYRDVESLSPAQIENQLPLPHFVSQKLLRAKRFDDLRYTETLPRALNEAVDMDKQIKGMPAVSFPLLERLIISLAR